MAKGRRTIPTAASVVPGKADPRRQRQPAIAYGGPVVVTRMGAYPNGVRKEETSRKRVLELWMVRWSTQLSPEQQKKFLEHPAMGRITAASPARVEAAVSRFKKLDEIADYLDK